MLLNPRHEIVAQERATGKTPAQACEAAGYDPKNSSFASNARKICCRKDVRARILEIQHARAELAEIDANWCLLKLKRRVNLIDGFNLDDYLTVPAYEGGPRFFDISRASREQLARLAELALEEEIVDAGEERMRRVRKTKLKGHATSRRRLP